jgi:uncharacterized protein YjbI with pentapeptide repeats
MTRKLTLIQRDQLKEILKSHHIWAETHGKDGEKGDLSSREFSFTDIMELFPQHKEFVDTRGKKGERLNLSEITFEGACLDFSNFQGVKLDNANFNNAELRSCKLSDTMLRNAELIGSTLINANLNGAWLNEAKMDGANLQCAKLVESDLGKATLPGAILKDCNLTNAILIEADLRGANLEIAQLPGARLFSANICGADLRHADFKGTYLEEVIYNKTEKYRGLRISDCFGGEVFVRFANDQSWLEDYKATRKGCQKLIRWLWWASCDYGQSLFRWAVISFALAVIFGIVYYLMGAEAYHLEYLSEYQGINRLFCFIYYSVVTFTTLGFGDILPKTLFATIPVVFEVISGYVMLGGLISILATMLARRS